MYVYNYYLVNSNFVDTTATATSVERLKLMTNAAASPSDRHAVLNVECGRLRVEVLAVVLVGRGPLVLGVGQGPARRFRHRHRLGVLHLPAAGPEPLVAGVREVVGGAPDPNQAPDALHRIE